LKLMIISNMKIRVFFIHSAPLIFVYETVS